jgi:hypothetical protein
MSGSLFYDVGKLDQIAINLFYGWGYNFYRLENQLRADDLMIRAKVGWLLGLSRASVETAQGAYRRKHLPPPSRAKPRPDPEALEAARSLEEVATSIGQLEGTIRALPVPETDRMTQRYRQEAQTLMALGECDKQLIGLADTLRGLLDGKDFDWILANLTTLREGIAVMTSRVQERQAILK